MLGRPMTIGAQPEPIGRGSAPEQQDLGRPAVTLIAGRGVGRHRR